MIFIQISVIICIYLFINSAVYFSMKNHLKASFMLASSISRPGFVPFPFRQSFSKSIQNKDNNTLDTTQHNRQIKNSTEDKKQQEENLENSENDFNILFHSIQSACILYRNNQIIDCNEAALKLLKVSKEQLTGLHLWDISPKFQSDGISSEAKCRKILHEITDKTSRQFKWHFQDTNKEIISVKGNLNIINIKEKKFITIFSPLTSILEHQLALQESEEKFRNIFNSVSDAIVISDLEGEILEINDVAVEHIGVSKDKLLRSNISNYVITTDFDKIKNYVKTIKSQEYRIFELAYTNVSGDILPIEVNVKHIKYNNKDAVIIVSRDISERKHLQKQLYRAMVESEERERERYAKELHDGLGPLLSTCKIYFYTLNVMKDTAKHKQYLSRAGELLEEALSSIKEISNNLSPHILRNYGLTNALHSFISKLTLLPKTDITINSDLQKRLSEIIEFTLYRTLVELINNSVKHAEADIIDIDLKVKDKGIYITYTDNGIGFNYEDLKYHGKGFGLLNLEHRIHEIGGDYDYFTNPGKGVMVKINVKDVIE